MLLRLDTDQSGRLKPSSPVAQEPLFSDLRDPEARCRPWPRKLCCRRPLHNGFFRWHRANKNRFAIKLELREHAGASLAIGFHGINPIVTARLADDGITVPVVCQGTHWDTHWDTILDLDTLPKRVPGGYVCGLCPEEDRPIFPARDDLWRDHLFGPFLQWVNDDLAKAAEISLNGTPDWASWARLVSEESA